MRPRGYRLVLASKPLLASSLEESADLNLGKLVTLPALTPTCPWAAEASGSQSLGRSLLRGAWLPFCRQRADLTCVTASAANPCALAGDQTPSVPSKPAKQPQVPRPKGPAASPPLAEPSHLPAKLQLHRPSRSQSFFLPLPSPSLLSAQTFLPLFPAGSHQSSISSLTSLPQGSPPLTHLGSHIMLADSSLQLSIRAGIPFVHCERIYCISMSQIQQ